MRRAVHTQTDRSQAGISIVEILISLLLGSLLAIGVIRVFAGSQASNTIILGEARLTDNARFAADALSYQLRLSGLRTDDETLPQVIFGAANPAIVASQGDDAADDAATRAITVSVGGANQDIADVRAKSDTLAVRYQGKNDPDAVLADANALDQSVIDCTGNTVNANVTSTDVFFVAASADGELSEYTLYCSHFEVDAAGNITADADNPVPVATDVLNMQIRLGEDTDADGVANRFVAPDFAGLQPDQVVGVEFGLTLSGARPLSVVRTDDVSSVEEDLQRGFVRTVSLRNLLR